ncbi:MAG: metalloregulator ArsR/SmtB family transcription factor [Dehalococcoidia bacterium]|nr:metalloregulator ArsR/SmtB family transcription factor [Dehalococcoidia bacterium]
MQLDIFEQFASVASALSTGSRLRLIDRLSQGEQTVEELARAADLAVPNASRQLKLLAEARLVQSRRVPPRLYYRLADDSVLRFWFALRDLTRERFAEVDQAVAAAFSDADPLEPVDQEELLRRLDSGDVLLIDVRPAPEYRAGHLPGAISVPLPELRDRLPDLPTDREVIAYCRGPYCFLSAEAVSELRARGIRALRLADGFPEWKAAGHPVEEGVPA